MSNFNALTNLQNNYPSSDEDENVFHENINKSIKEENVLPLPDDILNFNGYCIESEEKVDSSTNHNGKIRSFPHERGNWVSSLFVPVKFNKYFKFLSEEFICILQKCTCIDQFYIFDELHISLSKTLILQHHWIELFVGDMQKNCISMNRFLCHIDDIDVYVNDEKTRTFIGLKIGAGCNELSLLVKSIDIVLSEYNLPTYYDNPSFHTSIIWCLGDKRKEIIQYIQRLREMIKCSNQSELLKCNIDVQELHCKIGNLLYKIKLK